MASAEHAPKTLTGFRDYLLDCGACVVGVADLSGLSPSLTSGYPRAVSIGLALRADPILRLRSERERPAEAELPVLAALEELARITLRYLGALGARGTVLVPVDGEGGLTHEDIAVQAGIAWIGKSSRPVNWDFGTALRLTSVLTDADLPLDKPVEQSFCGTCLMCTEACVAHAPSGTIWKRGMKKGEFFNEAACRERRRGLAAVGRDCRFCMSVCPFTTVYMINSGLAVPNEGDEGH